jgi:PhzF family phenazine biosynthesis protein
MQSIDIYWAHAFTHDIFAGNPAAVCFLEHWLAESVLQRIAKENNLSETAFLVPCAQGFQIRWFAPDKEIQLCGHATLENSKHDSFQREEGLSLYPLLQKKFSWLVTGAEGSCFISGRHICQGALLRS